MVRVNCNYIPAFPFVYYKSKENYKRETNTLLMLLWPLLVWSEKNGKKLLALLYILFRLTYKEDIETQYIDLLWPIIHFEYNPSGFRFGIRPIMWIISGDGKFKFSLLGIINIFSSNNGRSVWFTIAPFIWYRYDHGRVFFTLFPILWITKKESHSHGDKWMFLLLPVGLIKKQSDGFLVNVALLIQFMVYDDYFSFFIFPFIVYHNRFKESLRISFAIIFYYSNIMSKNWKRFVIFPILWSSWSNDSTTFNFLPIVLYMRRDTNKFLSIAFIYYYRAITDTYRFHFIPIVLLYQNFIGVKQFLNVAVLFNYYRVGSTWYYILFPIYWYKNKIDTLWYFHIWPLIGYRKSFKDNGSSVYFIYPFIQFNNYHNGQIKYYHFFFRFIHYYNDRVLNHIRHGFFPLYCYSKNNIYNKGHVLLYLWYFQFNTKNLTTHNHKSPPRSEVEVEQDEVTPGYENAVQLEKPTDKIETYKQSTTEENQSHIPNPKELLSANSEYSYIFKSFLPLTFYWRNENICKFLFLPLILLIKWSLVEVDSFIFSPLFYQRKYQNFLKRFIIPIWYQKHTEDKDIVISPLYYYWRRLNNSFRLIAPIFIDVHKAETHLMILLLPIIIYYRKSIFKFTTFFPFFFRTQDASKSEIFTYWFPFYGKSYRGSNVNRYFLFPLFRIRLGKETRFFSLDILFPLFHYEKNHEDNSYSIRILPILWISKNNFNEMILVMPLFWKFVTDKDKRAQSNTLFLPFYFYRDSAEYEFKFVTPCFLPPYYVHYHREASQVENTYLLPFYSHQIKGLDHLKWICWYLYRHTYRDYSEYFTMNILLFFKHNSEKYFITGIAPLWVYWNNKFENSKHLRILLLLAYDSIKSKLIDLSRISIIWFVTTHLALICKKKLIKRQITKQESIADSINQMVQDELTPRVNNSDNGTIGISNGGSNDYNEDKYSKLEITTNSSKLYFFPIFHWKIDKAKEYSHFSILWLFKPFLSFFFKMKDSTNSLCFVFLLFVYKHDVLGSVTFALFWLIHPLVSLFLYENTPFSSVTRLIPLFWIRSIPDASKPRETNNGNIQSSNANNDRRVSRKRSSTRITCRSIAISIIYLIPNYGLFNFEKSSILYSIYLLPIWYYKNSLENSLIQFSLIWLISPFASLFNWTRIGNEITHRFFPIYYRITAKDKSSPHQSLLSIIWFFHPLISFIRYDDDGNNNIFCIFPIFWRKYSHFKKYYQISILYLVRKFGFIDYCRDESYRRFYILLLSYYRKENEKKYLSFIYLVHPKATFISAKFTPDYKKIFVFLAVYLKSSISQGFICSIIWIAHPKVSVISYWNKYQSSHFHILLLLWCSRIEEYYQVGICWIGAFKKSLYGNPYVNQSCPENEKISHIYCPISLYLNYNDGSYITVHLMPLFRYWSFIQKECEKFWGLLGLIYFSSKQRNSEFRWLYRWIRIKSGHQLLIVEVNPFVAYKNKNGDSTLLLLGGMCGCYPSMKRVCCIEC